MGTTLSSVHVYSTSVILGEGEFCSFSDGWQTYVPYEMPEDLFQLRSFGKKLSKRIDAPVLWFYVFDSEYICFEFYQNGKRISAYSQEQTASNKNLYGIPLLIGYDEGQKRRLSRIISCGDIDFQIELLEEYFGVCLLVTTELLNENPKLFRRERGDCKYLALLEEEKKLKGKCSPVGIELVYEQRGKLFEDHFGSEHLCFKPHCYMFGYSDPESLYHGDPLQPVRFFNGKLIPMTEEEFANAESKLRKDARKDERFSEEFSTVYKIHFTDKSPEKYRGKTLVPPRGYYFFQFDKRERVLLSDERGSVAVVDDSLKIIAKLRVKGMPVDYLDSYILTTGTRSFFEYGYSPKDTVRIYRVVDK